MTETKHCPLPVAPSIKVLRPLSLVIVKTVSNSSKFVEENTNMHYTHKYITKTYFMADLVL